VKFEVKQPQNLTVRPSSKFLHWPQPVWSSAGNFWHSDHLIPSVLLHLYFMSSEGTPLFPNVGTVALFPVTV